jgi:hypothetical protein
VKTEERIRFYLTSWRALLEGDREASLKAVDAAIAIPVDAEAVFYLARTLARLGDYNRAAVELRRVVAAGFWCVDAPSRRHGSPGRRASKNTTGTGDLRTLQRRRF